MEAQGFIAMRKNSSKPALGNYEHRIFAHHLYEYEKGLRNLVLFTTTALSKDAIEERLKAKNINCHVQEVNGAKVNIFFGGKVCNDIVRCMSFKSVSDLTAEEDFILGVMLGYDRLKQCERYLKRKHKRANLDLRNEGECQS